MIRLILRRGIRLTFDRSSDHGPPYRRTAMRNFTNHAGMEVADDIRVHQRPEHVTASIGSGMPSSPVLLGPLQRRGATKSALRRKLLVAMVSILSSMSVALASPSSN